MPDNSTQTASGHVYSPTQPGQIRILQLQAGRTGDSFIGELVTTPLNKDAMEYDALSYMWGDPTPTDVIWLSGKALPMAKNLTTALSYLRYVDKPLFIWIDAICIDQNNGSERAEQVHLMRRIYKGAKMVRTWIDEPDIDVSSEAMGALQNLIWKKSRGDPKVEDVFKLIGDDPSFWSPVLPLFQNGYWRRAWIQQEVLNAANFRLHCRDAVIPGRSVWCFKRAVFWLDKYRKLISDHRMIAWRGVCKTMMHQAPTDEGEMDFSWPLCQLMCRRLGCSRPQDRVYAIMHLAADYDEGDIAVDYSKTELEVGIDAAAHHVRKHRDVRFLHIAYLKYHKSSHIRPARLLDETTWIPRAWSGHRRNMALRGLSNKKIQTRCSLDAVSVVERRLRLRGVCVSRVKACLTSTFDTTRPTAHDLLKSPFGELLQSYVGAGKQELPEEVLEILVGDEKFRRIWWIGSEISDQLSQNSSNSSRGAADSLHKPKDGIGPVLYEAAVSALEVLLRLSGDPQRKHEELYKPDNHNLELFKDVDQVTMLVLQHMFRYLNRSMVIKTESNDLGRTTRCDLKMGDEVWVVLGCDYPLILRRLPNGRYWHVCSAEVPAIQGHQLFRTLSNHIQPGEKIGDWVVQDIEIE